MDFLTLDKNFVRDNFRFVQDKKYFVRADGRGKSVKTGGYLLFIQGAEVDSKC